MFFFASFAFSTLYTSLTEEKSFLSWMRNTNNFYTGDEYNLRFGIYLANKKYVEQFNRAGKSFTLALNKFACYTPAEYNAMLGIKTSFTLEGRKVAKRITAVSDVPDNFDYREKGCVNDVKDQSSCGGCWAFSAIQAQETTDAIKTGKLLRLSESNLIDCANIEFTGFHGGWPDKALLYVIKEQQGKFCLDSDYAYRPYAENCQFDSKEHYSSISDVQFIPRDEENMKVHLATIGALSICVDASHASFQLYNTGVYEEPGCTKGLYNHAVGCVGYGVDGDLNKAYWIVRNSWGPSWGESGYIRFFRGADTCNIADAASYSIY